ncbi:hypothetical protein NDI54_17945 [Haloarcula sp. S1AR25-5A]|jgi:hypothetical protein|uniref:Uncharacterized protein n=5 Tax=Halobacteriales TaxID=2235 RepID=A0A8J8P7D3_9EURY|nr:MULTISPECIES: hypothetical protein [Halobacteria]MDF9748097.1 hypothetical protein [Natrinema salsiterrestre]MDS0223228.1 hypothetical protein [Haloarcula terrestris]MDS0280105.1 hypothetical protein [Halomicroarcula sp. S1AR25-4]MDS0284292.1 hypothetical protein [Halomicroarcula sp. S3CR25-11]MDS0301255.1 hypothetical protein [Halogeometricum sp. S1BR25-6]
MSEEISANRAGLIFGAIFAASHAAWIGFVVSGVSETAVATVARTNFVEYEDTVDFDLSLAGAGLMIALVAGYLMGGLFALLWNRHEIHDDG